MSSEQGEKVLGPIYMSPGRIVVPCTRDNITVSLYEILKLGYLCRVFTWWKSSGGCNACSGPKSSLTFFAIRFLSSSYSVTLSALKSIALNSHRFLYSLMALINASIISFDQLHLAAAILKCTRTAGSCLTGLSRWFWPCKKGQIVYMEKMSWVEEISRLG